MWVPQIYTARSHDEIIGRDGVCIVRSWAEMASAMQVVVRGHFGSGAQTRSIYTFADQTDLGTSVLNPVLSTYLTSLYATILAITSNAWSADAVDVNKVTGKLADPISSFDFVADGTAGGDELPQQDAYIVIGKTAIKRTLGRKFLPAIPESVQNAGLINSTARTALANYCALWTTAVTISGTLLTPGTYNRKTSLFHAFTGYRVDPYTATQRRRRTGVGI
jgi:hypothetical protein